MKLKQWLVQENLSPAAFARQIMVSRQLVQRWLDREHAPTLEKADTIRRATNGAVDFTDWLKPSRKRTLSPQRPGV